MARGNVRVSITAENDQLKRKLRESEGLLGRADKSMRGAAKGAAGALAGAFAVDQIVGAASAAVGAASDINESLTKNNVLFGKSAERVTRFSDTAAESFGIARKAALEYTGVYGNLFRALGLGQRESAKFSVKLTKLAADMASFNNTSIEDALEAIRSGLVGETEPLRRFGVNLNQAALESEALSSGLVKADVDQTKMKASTLALEIAQRNLGETVREHGAKSTEAMKAQLALENAQARVTKTAGGQKITLTAAQKAMAAQSLIVKQTEAAHGDFARTSDGLANQQRILKAELSNLSAEAGKVLLPAVLSATRALNEFVIGLKSGKDATGGIRSALQDIRPVVEAFKDVARAVGPAVTEMARGVLKRFEALGEGIRGTAKIISGILRGDFGKAWDGVKTLFRAQVKQVVGILQTSTAPFRKAGEAIGGAVFNGISAGFKSVVGFMEDRLNDVIGVINSAIGVFNKLPGPDIGKIPQIGGGGASRSEIVRALPTGRAPSTGRQLPHGTSSTGRSNFIARAASVGGGGATARTASVPGGGFRAQAASLSGRKYSARELAALWVQAGGNPGEADLMAAIALAESGGYAGARNDSSGAAGLWQIHPPEPGSYDALTNARIAVRKRNSQGLGAWEAYTNGSYKRYLGRAGSGARAAVSSTPAVVAGGKFLQGRGLQVGESSHFGGVTTNRHKHYPNDHYSGRSIDVNYAGGGSAELTRLQSALGALKQRFGSAIDFAMIEDAGGGNQHLHVTFKNRSVAGAALGGLGRVAPRLTASLGRVVSSAVPPSQRRRGRADAAPGLAFGEALVASMNARAGLTGDVVADATDPALARQANTMRRFQIGVRLNAINARLSQFGVPLAERTALLNEQASLTSEATGLNAAFNAPATPSAGAEDTTGQQLDALRDEMEKQTAILQQQLDRANELTALEREGRQEALRQFNVLQSNSSTIIAGLIDTISGGLGGKLGLGFSTPSYAGAGARY